MSRLLRAGIDVGGTHTDAVLMHGTTVVATHKAATTADVTSGIVDALRVLLERSGVGAADLAAVLVGTTHFTNAFVQGRDLASVAIVRLGYPATDSVPPLSDWPDATSAALGSEWFLCRGGREFDGRASTEVDDDELVRVAARIRQRGLESVAITGVFAPTDASSERRAAEVLAAHLPGIPITRSSEVGQLGFLARENAAVINASLRPLAQTTVASIASAMAELGTGARVLMSQNDGTLADLATTERRPVGTFTSGPTNSMRGAAFLAGLTNCTVIDIGGTTADLGVVEEGFPRETATTALIGGVPTNFRLPDVVSLAIGGGSIAATGGEPTGDRPVGPLSVGHAIRRDALVFGGGTVTATDLAVAAGRASVGDPTRVAHLDGDHVERVMRYIDDELAAAVDRMQTSAHRPDVVLAGGGSILVADRLDGVARLVRPDHLTVANAVGAAIGEIGATVEQLVSYTERDRDEALASVADEARRRAVAAGAARDEVRIVNIEEAAVPYLAGSRTRVRVRAVGSLQLEDARVPAH